jgi:hypothetical protein
MVLTEKERKTKEVELTRKGKEFTVRNGNRGIAEKEHPNAPTGTVKGHKTTKKQQALFGIARGMQKSETPKGYSPLAAKLAGKLSGKEIHKIASKPKGGYRRNSKSEEEAAFARVMRMVAEVEAERPGPAAPNGLPSHAIADKNQFAEISHRLETIEARLAKLETPGSSNSYAR